MGKGGKENQFPKAKQALPDPRPLVTLQAAGYHHRVLLTIYVVHHSDFEQEMPAEGTRGMDPHCCLTQQRDERNPRGRGSPCFQAAR